MQAKSPVRPKARTGQAGLLAGVALAMGTGALVPVWLAALPGRAAAQEERRAVEMEPARREEVARVWEETKRLAARTEGLDGATAFREAKRLGIVEAVRSHRPRLRAQAVRRLSVAIVREARRQQLDPLFLAAVMRVESGFDPQATSQRGARGLLQVMPDTARALLTRRGEALTHADALYDIETNVSVGAEYLRGLLERFPTERAALLAYNRGPRGARETLRSPDAQLALSGYPRLVLAEKARLLAQARRRESPAPAGYRL
jgi:soluble lytic murein transglycosylase